MRKICCNYLGIFLILLFVSCDEQSNNHPINFDKNYSEVSQIKEVALSYLVNNQIDSAIDLFRYAISHSDSLEYYNLFDLYLNLSSCYYSIEDYKSSINYVKKGLEFYKNGELTQLDDFNSWSISQIMLSSSYRNTNNHDSALRYLENLYLVLENNNLINSRKYYSIEAEVYTWMALIYSDIGEFEKSIKYNIKAIKLLDANLDTTSIISKNYSQLGQIFTLTEEFSKAKYYYLKANSIINKFYGKNSLAFAENISSLGLILYEEQRYREALHQFLKVQGILLKSKLSPTSPAFGSSYNNLGDAYSHLGEYVKGINHYKNALDIFKKNNLFEEECVVYHNLGIAYSNLNNWKVAENYYSRSLRLGNKMRNSNNIYTAYTHQRLGQLYFKQKRYDFAIKFYEKAIDELSLINNEYKYYPFYFLRYGILSKIDLLESLHYKGLCELKAYCLTKDILLLNESVISFNKALQILDFTRTSFNSEKSKVYLSKISSPLINNIIEAYIFQSKYQSSESLDNKVLEAIERNKYNALRSIIQSTKKEPSHHLPINFVDKIDTLYRRIRYYENLLSQHRKIDCNNIILGDLEENLFNSFYSLDTLQNCFINASNKINLEDYYSAGYSIEYLQKLLPDSFAIIECFMGDSLMIIIAINKDFHMIHTYESVYEMKSKISQYKNAIQFSDMNTFYNNSRYLYDNVILPIYPIIEDVSNLIIIPSGELSGVPFETLINSDENHSNDLKSQEYLISNFNISYHFSLNLWGDSQKSDERNSTIEWQNTFSGFAPMGSLDNSQDINALDIVTLSSSIDEVYNISDLFAKSGKRSKSFIGKEATEKAIIKELQNSKILHIASHSISDSNYLSNYIVLNNYENNLNRIQLPSQIIDSDSSFFSTEDGKFFLRELYNLDVYSDLVTLSTCNSGSGPSQLGEGNQSLALGLYYSGAKNILYTLWNISDIHATTFMTIFYSYVNNGLPYSLALKQTKLELINSNNSLPIFWSGYLLNN